MIEGSVAKRAGTPDEVGAVGALLMGPDGVYLTPIAIAEMLDGREWMEHVIDEQCGR